MTEPLASMSGEQLLSTTTVEQAAAFALRAKQSLYEAGHPDLAERVAVVIRPDGGVFLSCVDSKSDGDGGVLRKAVSIDPDFEPVEAS